MKQGLKNSNKILRIIFAFASLVFINNGNAQTSIFQDADGESAFKVFGSAVTINTKDENISFSSDFINKAFQSNTKFNRWGVSAKIIANEGIANLKDEKGFLIDGQIGIYRGWKKTKLIGAVASPGPGWAHEKYISLNGSVDRNKIFNVNNLPDNLVYNKGYGGWKLEAGWFGYYGDVLWGISANSGKKTNVDDIKQKVISRLSQSINNDTITVVNQESAYDANQFKTGLNNFNLNGDIGISLTKNFSNNVGPLLLAFHFRYQALEKSKPKFNPAIGFYISKVGAPQDVVIGLNVQLQDAFNVDNSDNSFWKRTTLNLTAGFKIN